MKLNVTMSPELFSRLLPIVRTVAPNTPEPRRAFASLLQLAEADLAAEPIITALPTAEFKLALAAAWLGPRCPPSPAVWDSLATHLLPLAAQASVDALELVTAHGCGWRRAIPAGATGWDGRWDGALLALTERIDRFVQDAHRQLLARGVPLPEEARDCGAALPLLIRLYRPLSPLHLDTGEALVFETTDAGALIRGASGHEEQVPPGAKALFTARIPGDAPLRLTRSSNSTPWVAPSGALIRVTAMDFETRITLKHETTETTAKLSPGDSVCLRGPACLDIWECTCGDPGCARRHRLDHWDPAAPHGSLANFLGTAVKGPLKTLQVNSFQQGMLFPYWAREGF